MPKRKINSKDKGDRFERLIANIFSDWAKAQGRQCEIRRTPRSGGWSHSKKMAMTADIIADDPTFPFTIEAKDRQEWSQRGLYINQHQVGVGPIWSYWQQCLEECGENKKSLLVFTRKEKGCKIPSLCILQMDDWSWGRIPDTAHFLTDHRGLPVILMRLADFLDVATWE